jgi:hypothetical protein
MTTKSDYSLSPSKPYEEFMCYQFTLYDNMPYVWDTNNEKHLTYESGNIIKGCRCQLKEPYEIKH